MIAIRKGLAPPGLISAGEEHARVLCAAYDADPESFRRGEKRMEIRESIYASEAVKANLVACHHGKCCYCETHIPVPYADAHVEHWRPKSSSRQGRGEKSIWPGYYWLAYSWDNLLLSCPYCNRNNKRDLFPLDDPSARARHHGMPLENETPCVLKPDGGEDPRNHIRFELDEPIGLTPIGRNTIEVLRLETKFQEDRLAHFQRIRHARELCIEFMNSVDPKARRYSVELRAIIEDAVRPEQPYSAMVAAYLETNPLPRLAAATVDDATGVGAS